MVRESFYFWLHLVIIILVWLSPFFLDWKIIFAFIILFYTQLFFFKECVINLKHFKNKPKELSFHSYFLEKIGFNLSRRKVYLVVRYVIPWIILILALLWQIVLKR